MRASLLGVELARQTATACNGRVATGPDRPHLPGLLAERAPVDPLVAAPNPGAVAESVEPRLEVGLRGAARAARRVAAEAEVVELVRILPEAVALDLVAGHALAGCRVGDPGVLDVHRVSREDPAELTGRVLARV